MNDDDRRESGRLMLISPERVFYAGLLGGRESEPAAVSAFTPRCRAASGSPRASLK